MVCKHTSGTIEGEEINCWGIYVGVYLLHLSEATLFNNFEMNDDQQDKTGHKQLLVAWEGAVQA